MFMCFTIWSSVVNLDLFWKQVFSYTCKHLTRLGKKASWARVGSTYALKMQLRLFSEVMIFLARMSDCGGRPQSGWFLDECHWWHENRVQKNWVRGWRGTYVIKHFCSRNALPLLRLTVRWRSLGAVTARRLKTRRPTFYRPTTYRQ